MCCFTLVSFSEQEMQHSGFLKIYFAADLQRLSARRARCSKLCFQLMNQAMIKTTFLRLHVTLQQLQSASSMNPVLMSLLSALDVQWSGSFPDSDLQRHSSNERNYTTVNAGFNIAFITKSIKFNLHSCAEHGSVFQIVFEISGQC